MKSLESTRIAIAMSGGVDSSVAALILKEQGFEIFGVTMQVWGEEKDQAALEEVQDTCCSPYHTDDARAVACRLGIRHYLLNFRSLFEEYVIQPFCQEYLRGRTPNPCVLCNEHLKFRLLYEKVRQLGATHLASGHYARKEWDPETQTFRLLKAVDLSKDQSYFLFSLTQEMLSHTLFPLGGLTKPEARTLARTWGLATADKPESQDICFVPGGDYRSVVERYVPAFSSEGDFIAPDGKVLGPHKGLHHYTVGQRRGLGIALGEPAYVVAIQSETNQVVLGPNAALMSTGLEASRVSWIRTSPTATLEAVVKIRYNHPGIPAIIEPLPENMVRVRFSEPQRAVAPGQAAVFYNGEEVLGGGWIDQALWLPKN